MENQINENKCRKKFFNAGFLLFLTACVLRRSGFEISLANKSCIVLITKNGAILSKLK